MERLAIDVLGQLPQSDDGNRYNIILIAADYFSKWVEAYALQGRNFESVVFSEMCGLLGITITRTTPLHLQSDGMVERFNRMLESQLSKFVEDHQRDWDSHLPLLLMAYRIAVHESTGYTPASLMLGRDLRLPIDENLEARLEQVQEFA